MKVFSPGKVACVVEHGTRNGLQRRGLKEVAVEAAQHPVQARNLDGCADAGIGRRLVQSGAVDGEALAAEQRDVLAQAQMVGEVELDQRGAGVGRRVGLGGRAAVVDQHAEEIVLPLIERVDAGGEAVRAGVKMRIGLPAHVVRGLMPGGRNGLVGGE